MKKGFIWLMAFLMVLSLITIPVTKTAAEGEEAYAVYDSDTTTLTFKYDANKPADAFDLDNYGNWQPWSSFRSHITTVVFEPSFANARPKRTAHWFIEFLSLTEIRGLEYLNTSEVTNMGAMFMYCQKLTELDLSTFDTKKVENMNSMFMHCSGLTSLNLSSFDTSNVTDMGHMFFDCSKMKTFDLSTFDTSNVTNMSNMFRWCFEVTSLNLSNFNTSNVTDMSEMFCEMDRITLLDLRSFDTSNVTDMNNMFSFDYLLERICVDESKWSMQSVENSEKMFYKSSKLVGCAGTVYDENHVDGEYAHIDGGTENPGYLSDTLTTPYDVFIRTFNGILGNNYRLNYTICVKDTHTDPQFQVILDGENRLLPELNGAAFHESRYTCWQFSKEPAPSTAYPGYTEYYITVKAFAKLLNQKLLIKVTDNDEELNIRSYEYINEVNNILIYGHVSKAEGHSVVEYVRLLETFASDELKSTYEMLAMCLEYAAMCMNVLPNTEG